MLNNRRKFIKQSAVAAGALAFSQPITMLGQSNNHKLRIGIIGCGGRGKIVGELAIKDGRYEVVAVADYFQEQVDTLGEQFGVAAERRYTGLNCHQRLLDAGGVDIVAILTPPLFPSRSGRSGG